MLPTGISIRVEFSITVQLTSIMQFSWLDHLIKHGQSRTVGEKLGEKKDILDWQKEIHVMFALVLPLPFDSHQLIIIFMIKLLTLFNRFQLSTQIAKSASPILRHETDSGKDKYRNYHKTGP